MKAIRTGVFICRGLLHNGLYRVGEAEILRQALSFLAVPVFQRPHPHMPLEIFAKERHIREIQRIGDVVYGKIGRFQLCLCIHDHHRCDDLDTSLVGRLLDDRAEMRRSYAEFLGIPRNVPLRGIVFHNQLTEVLAYLLRFGNIRFVQCLVFVHGSHSEKHP